MNKFLMLSGLLIGGNAFAAFVQCTPNTADFINNSAPVTSNFTCNPSAAAGNIAGDGLNVTSIQFVVSGSGQIAGGTVGTTYGASATITNNAGLTNPGNINISCLADAFGSCVAGPQSQGPTTTAVGPVDQFGAFTVTVAGLQNARLPFLNNGTATVFYMATTAPVGVPEPATFGLMGAALLGLGLARKRFSN